MRDQRLLRVLRGERNEHDDDSNAPGSSDRRRPGRARGRGTLARAEPRAARAGGRRRRRRERRPLGARAGLLPLADGDQRCRRATPAGHGLEGARSERLPDRWRPSRRLPGSARDHDRPGGSDPGRPPRRRSHTTAPLQAARPRPRGCAVRARRRDLPRTRTHARTGRDRRERQLHHPEPARRLRHPGRRRDRARGQDRVRATGRARRPRPVRGPAGARRRRRSLGDERPHRPGRAQARAAERADRVGDPSRQHGDALRVGGRRPPATLGARAHDRHARRGRRRRARPGHRDHRDHLDRRRHARRAPEGSAGAVRRDRRRDRVPPRPVDPLGAAPRPRPGRRGAIRDRAADRSERPLLRHRASPRRPRARASRAGPLLRRHEELRTRADVLDAHRIRAGALDRRRTGRRRGGSRTGRAGAARDRGLQRQRWPAAARDTGVGGACC